jgi:antitoxin component YwqK of YwqJK toxin-antitoxin module
MEGSFEMGSREGEWITYNPKGIILTKSNYENDKLEGIVVAFDEAGKILTQTGYKNDEIISKINY